MLKSKKILSNSLIFTGMTVMQKGIGFFLLPLYTSLLSTEEYGLTNLITAVCGIYSLIFSLALDDAIARYYVEYNDNKEKQKTLITTVTVTAIFTSVVGIIIILLGHQILLDPFTADVMFVPYVLLGLVPVGCTSVYSLMQKLLIIEGRATTYSINTLVFFILNTVFCILFIAVYHLGALGFLLSASIVYVIYFIYSFQYLLKRMNFKFDKNIAIEVLKYGGILLPNRVASWGMTSLNKVILGNSISVAALGIYNIAINFSSILNIFSNSVAMAIQPWIYDRLKRNSIDDKKNISTLLSIISIVYCLGGFGIALFSSNIVYALFNDSYWTAGKVIPILAFGETASAYSTLFVYVLFYYKNLTKYIAISTFIGAFISIGFSVVLVPFYGIFGCAISVTFANIVVCIIKNIIAYREVKTKIILMYLLSIVTFIISMFVIEFSLSIKIVIFIFVSLVCLVFQKKNIIKCYQFIKNER